MKTVGIIMNGVTGRMGTNQHLLRSIVPIIKQGGVHYSPTESIMPDPILVGRNAIKVEALAKRAGVAKWTTDLDAVLADPAYSVYFDAQGTTFRADAVKKAIAAGKHVYCEKPTAVTTEAALELYQVAKAAGVKNGVVQDKLWLPGFVKLKSLIDRGYFGEILSVKGEFGYWVFEGDTVPAQRPSWNYRKEDGGGMVVDMLCHWRYLIDNVFGPVQAVSCTTATHVKQRIDEAGKPFPCTADDAAYSTFRLVDGTIVHFNSSWCTRVRRDDLLTVQVDGSEGSAVATLRDVYLQPYGATPRAIWNPDIAQPIDFFDTWIKMPEQAGAYDNAFKIQWELFLRHVALDEPFRWTLLEGAKGVQLAEYGLKSNDEKRWIDLPALEA
ncbi:MAG: Gfo/Idh/MocA family oxidoreductase [Kiritimatiellae bacterium]|jgi:predicted dehydrogenase|nr:Gfo/Idh/MocA family oxidoreductase [Kiritimatiellia bacterium]NLE40546.1 Gfo/Idh/MocA family oxidoreductase [Lentisphaerota bacterium]